MASMDRRNMANMFTMPLPRSSTKSLIWFLLLVMVAGQKVGLPYREMWAAFHAVTEPLQESSILGHHTG